MVDFKPQDAFVMDPTLSAKDNAAALRQAIKECYCGLGPACEIWTKMTPEERAVCTRDKRAYSQLLWKHGVNG